MSFSFENGNAEYIQNAPVIGGGGSGSGGETDDDDDDDDRELSADRAGVNDNHE